MRALIAEDDYTSRVLLQRLLAPYATCTIAVNGKKAVEAFQAALDKGQYYDLVCLDVLMPEMDGHAALACIRELEKEHNIDQPKRANVIMTTGLADLENVRRAIHGKCQGYLIKPLDKQKLLGKLKTLGLLKDLPHEETETPKGHDSPPVAGIDGTMT